MQTTISILGGMFDSTSVVETVNGFPRGDKAVDASFFARMMRCFYSDGVIRPTEGHLQVSAGDGLRLQVSPGCGWIFGHMAWIPETVTAEVEAGHSYLVLLRLHRTDGRFTLEFLEDQSAIARDDALWDLLLAEASVPAGAAAVTADMLTDRRLDERVCGAVDSPVTGLQAVAYAADAGAVGGVPAADLVPKTGCRMTGVLQAYNDATGAPAVRNIRYGTALPETMPDGEIFILLAEEA